MIHVFDKRRFSWVPVNEASQAISSSSSTLLSAGPPTHNIVKKSITPSKQNISSIIQYIRERINVGDKSWTKVLIFSLFVINMHKPIIYILMKLYRILREVIRVFSFRKLILKVLPHTKKTLPISIQATLTELTQPVQFQLAEEAMSKYPETGLYDAHSSNNTNIFRNFCNHIMNVFSKSPRAMLLNRIDAQLQAMITTKPKVEELYKLLNLKKTTRFTKVCEEFEALSPGILYNAWKSIIAESQSYIDSHKKRKALNTEAKEMWLLVEEDKDYIRWKEVQSIWYSPEFQINNMYCEYRSLDKETNQKLKDENEETTELVYTIVRNRLLKKHPNLSRYKKWNYFTRADWIDNVDEKSIGDIDIVIVVMGPKGYVVMAIVQYKRNYFDIPNAFQENKGKVLNYKNNSIMIRSNKIVNTQAESIQKWLVNDVVEDTKLDIVFEPPIYIVCSSSCNHNNSNNDTNMMFGASGDIIDAISCGIFSGGANFDDDNYINKLMNDVKDKCDLSISPMEILQSQDDKIILI